MKFLICNNSISLPINFFHSLTAVTSTKLWAASVFAQFIHFCHPLFFSESPFQVQGSICHCPKGASEQFVSLFSCFHCRRLPAVPCVPSPPVVRRLRSRHGTGTEATTLLVTPLLLPNNNNNNNTTTTYTATRTPQVLSRVRYQRSKPNLSTFLQKVLPPISKTEPNQIFYIQHQ